MTNKAAGGGLYGSVANSHKVQDHTYLRTQLSS